MDGPATREVCEVARTFHLPLLYEPVGKTDLIDLLAPQYPDVNFIIYLVQAVKRGGAYKFLFGSDSPWLHPGLELHKIRLLGLPPKEEAFVLVKNLTQLLSTGVPCIYKRLALENMDKYSGTKQKSPRRLHTPAGTFAPDYQRSCETSEIDQTD